MSAPISICTIIAKNYLAHARTLCASFLEHHPEGRCYVLVIDDHAPWIDPAAERFALVSLGQIPLPERPDQFCFKYDVTELATAVKPFFLRWLLETHALPGVFYLDPDILVTAPLDVLYARLLSGGGLLLTPHLTTDFPEDGLTPDERHVLRSGMFNLGFLGLRAGAPAAQFLPWIEHKLTDRCVIDHAAGLFVDQRFFDLAPFLFPELCDVERHPGYNVAYWNLHSRTLAPDPNGAANRWLCNGETLCFFHFSSYNPTRPESISGHQTRFRLADRPDLQAIFERYRTELWRHGYDEVRRWPYTYATFANGQAISYAVRRYYRGWKAAFPDVDPFRSPDLLRKASLYRAFETLDRAIKRLPESSWRDRLRRTVSTAG